MPRKKRRPYACARCGTALAFQEVAAATGEGDGIRLTCVPCASGSPPPSRDYKNPEGLVALQRRADKYGIPLNDLTAFMGANNHRCAICLAKTDLVVDHDHGTGAVRGTLCQHCNSGLGFFRDDPARLGQAIFYLGQAKGREE